MCCVACAQHWTLHAVVRLFGNNEYSNRPKLNWEEWDARRMREELEGRGFSFMNYSNMAGDGYHCVLQRDAMVRNA